ncbi:MAG: heavy metal translocating P-type ATPase metal-binding domain-containing protein [Bacteroidota bacterium]
MSSKAITRQQVQCFHCGEDCNSSKIHLEEKIFCCEGCKMVYQVINQNGLCDYYNLNDRPGVSQRIAARKDKFAFLDDEVIQAKLVSFHDDKQTHITFYLRRCIAAPVFTCWRTCTVLMKALFLPG